MNIDYNIQRDVQCDVQGEVHGEVQCDVQGEAHGEVQCEAHGEVQGEIIGLNEDDIINFDNIIVGFIYIKKYGKKIWKKKYFVLGNNIFEYWKSNKKTNNGVVRIKEVIFSLNSAFDLSCLK